MNSITKQSVHVYKWMLKQNKTSVEEQVNNTNHLDSPISPAYRYNNDEVWEQKLKWAVMKLSYSSSLTAIKDSQNYNGALCVLHS